MKKLLMASVLLGSFQAPVAISSESFSFGEEEEQARPTSEKELVQQVDDLLSICHQVLSPRLIENLTWGINLAASLQELAGEINAGRNLEALYKRANFVPWSQRPLDDVFQEEFNFNTKIISQAAVTKKDVSKDVSLETLRCLPRDMYTQFEKIAQDLGKDEIPSEIVIRILNERNQALPLLSAIYCALKRAWEAKETMQYCERHRIPSDQLANSGLFFWQHESPATRLAFLNPNFNRENPTATILTMTEWNQHRRTVNRANEQQDECDRYEYSAQNGMFSTFVTLREVGEAIQTIRGVHGAHHSLTQRIERTLRYVEASRKSRLGHLFQKDRDSLVPQENVRELMMYVGQIQILEPVIRRIESSIRSAASVLATPDSPYASRMSAGSFTNQEMESLFDYLNFSQLKMA